MTDFCLLPVGFGESYDKNPTGTAIDSLVPEPTS